MPSSHANIPAVEDPDSTHTRLASHSSFPYLRTSFIKAPQPYSHHRRHTNDARRTFQPPFPPPARMKPLPPRAPRRGQVEHLVYPEIRVVSPNGPSVDPLGPIGRGGRFASFPRRTQPSPNGPKEFR